MDWKGITRDQLKIKIHHVGGIGGYGPTTVLSKLKHVQWIVYDQEKEALNKSERLKERDLSFVNKCVGKNNGKAKFNLTFGESASSLLKPEREAFNYTIINSDGTAQIWGLHTRVVKSFGVRVYSLGWLVNKKKVPEIDFLSIDAQGAELDILNGAAGLLKTTILGVVCETDFVELYNKQPLFGDIQLRLAQDKFRLCQIYNHQFFNNWPNYKEFQGKGFDTAAESLFLKVPNYFNYERVEDIVRALKLAAIGVAFDQLDFSMGVIRSIEGEGLFSIKELANKTKVFYLRLLDDLYTCAKNAQKSYHSYVYASTNASDRGLIVHSENLKSRITRNFSKLLIFLKYWSILVRRGILNGNKAYFSDISMIYGKYGFHDLARAHDTRYLYYLLNLYPSKIDRILNFFCNFKLYKEAEMANRNYFKGSY